MGQSQTIHPVAKQLNWPCPCRLRVMRCSHFHFIYLFGIDHLLFAVCVSSIELSNRQSAPDDFVVTSAGVLDAWTHSIHDFTHFTGWVDCNWLMLFHRNSSSHQTEREKNDTKSVKRCDSIDRLAHRLLSIIRFDYFNLRFFSSRDRMETSNFEFGFTCESN